MDRSGSLQGHYDDVKLLVKEVMLKFDTSLTRFGATTFNDVATPAFFLNTYGNASPMVYQFAVENDFPTTAQGGTDLAAALQVTRTQILVGLTGDRPNVKNVCLLISDGQLIPRTGVLGIEAAKLRKKCCLYTIGVGSHVNHFLLQSITPIGHYFQVSDFDDLKNNLGNIVNAICDC